jgi:hypothetical protein
MSMDRFEVEQKAARSLLELLDKAQECRELYEKAKMSLPEPLMRVLGMSENGSKPPARVEISGPMPSRKPHGFSNDWIWIDVKDASPTSLVLAILKDSASAVRAKDVTTKVAELLPESNSGSVANIGNRLDGSVIRRDADGWVLIQRERGGEVFDGKLWGPPSIFNKHELAAHRRDAILHVLRGFKSGLQTSQLTERLNGSSWVKAPVNKDLVKEDMEALASAKRIRRRGNSQKWELAPEESL